MQHEVIFENVGYACGPDFEEISKDVYATCRVCEKSFSGRGGFQKHVKFIHQSDQVFPCKKSCGKTFATKLLEVKHRRSHTKIRNIPCESCDLKFFSEATLKCHVLNCHYSGYGEDNQKRKIHESVRLPDGKLKYKCDVCDKLLSSNKLVYHHKSVFHGGPIELLHCPYEGCTYTGKLRANLNNHYSRAHGSKKHICDQCGKDFFSPKDLKIHYMKHHKAGEHKCDECGKVYSNPVTLYNHKKGHGEPNHICSKCGKAFIRYGSLKMHMNFVHTDIKRFICLCGKAFKTKPHLHRHWKEKGHDEGKKLEEDGETFLNIHM